MRFLRFSIRRLLILTALVAVLLYVLLIRPVAIAKEFAHEIETSTDLATLSDKHFGGMDSNGARVDAYLSDRTWANVFKCQQNITITMMHPMPSDRNRLLISKHHYYSTPLGIHELGEAYLAESRLR